MNEKQIKTSLGTNNQFKRQKSDKKQYTQEELERLREEQKKIFEQAALEAEQEQEPEPPKAQANEITL